MLTFLDIFPEFKDCLTDYKVHLATGRINKKAPLFELTRNKFKEWQEYQNNKNFERKYILSFIYYSPNEWIFGGVYKRKDVSKAFDEERDKEYWHYKTELLDIQKDLIGRLVFRFEKAFRQSYVLLEKHYHALFACELLKKPYHIEEFPGYENVRIDFDLLKEIFLEEEVSWKTALSNIKGVYLITDKQNGKHYVGSAYGEYAFWNRWALYARNGHGNNIELKKVIEKQGFEYASNFQFVILEIRNMITDDDVIIRRESYWKEILLSREFGYNAN
jgi:hypothetical protein